MNTHCQECKQPLLLQQSQASILRESYDNLEDLLKSSVNPMTGQPGLPSLDDHALYCFGLSGDLSQYSNLAERELRVKDLVSGGSEGQGAAQVQLRYPVCFDCFEQIIRGLDIKILQKEAERDIYIRELKKLESKLIKAKSLDESKLLAELRLLEAEEAELDKELQKLDQEEL